MTGSEKQSRPSLISEIVVGGFIHDPGEDNNEADTWDLNLEIVFRKVTFVSFENRYLRFCSRLIRLSVAPSTVMMKLTPHIWR